MGRKSKLTPDQWAEIDRRMAAGEGQSALAREFGMSPAQITRRKVSAKPQLVREVAQKLADAQNALAELPVSQQYTALSLAEKLRSISSNLASAAEYGAKTAHRLHALANSEVAKVDDADPIASVENLRNVGVLTKLANESAHCALNLVAANKETVSRLNAEKLEVPAIDPALLADSTIADLMAARAPR